MSEQSQDIPRFVVTLADTKTDVQLSAGADTIRDFRKPLPVDMRKPGVRNELDMMFVAFQEDIAEIEKMKDEDGRG
jgi:hypothetical protein